MIKVLLVIGSAIIIQVVVTDDREARVVLGLGFSVVTHGSVYNPIASLAAFVGQVAHEKGENAFRVVALGGDILI